MSKPVLPAHPLLEQLRSSSQSGEVLTTQDETRLALADWLLEQGSLFGECIQVQLALKNKGLSTEDYIRLRVRELQVLDDLRHMMGLHRGDSHHGWIGTSLDPLQLRISSGLPTEVKFNDRQRLLQVSSWLSRCRLRHMQVSPFALQEAMLDLVMLLEKTGAESFVLDPSIFGSHTNQIQQRLAYMLNVPSIRPLRSLHLPGFRVIDQPLWQELVHTHHANSLEELAIFAQDITPSTPCELPQLVSIALRKAERPWAFFLSNEQALPKLRHLSLRDMSNVELLEALTRTESSNRIDSLELFAANMDVTMLDQVLRTVRSGWSPARFSLDVRGYGDVPAQFFEHPFFQKTSDLTLMANDDRMAMQSLVESKHLTSLRHLSFCAKTAFSFDLERLSRKTWFSSLETLALHQISQLNGLARAFKAVQFMPRLKALHLHGKSNQVFDASSVAKWDAPLLTQLSLNNVQLTDRTLASLIESGFMHKIQQLSLKGNLLTEKSIAPLMSLVEDGALRFADVRDNEFAFEPTSISEEAPAGAILRTGSDEETDVRRQSSS